LIRRIWPEGTFVDYERGLNAAVTRLRQVMGDSADTPRYVETVGRKGYRFIAPVEYTPVPEIVPPANEGIDGRLSHQRHNHILEPKQPAAQAKLSGLLRYAAVLVIGVAASDAAVWWRSTPPAPTLQPLLRFSVELEKDSTPAGLGTSLALSPDGTRLVVAVRG